MIEDLHETAIRLGREALEYLRAGVDPVSVAAELPRLELLVRLGIEAEVARARIRALEREALEGR